jgi:hypothetical protein
MAIALYAETLSVGRGQLAVPSNVGSVLLISAASDQVKLHSENLRMSKFVAFCAPVIVGTELQIVTLCFLFRWKSEN